MLDLSQAMAESAALAEYARACHHVVTAAHEASVYPPQSADGRRAVKRYARAVEDSFTAGAVLRQLLEGGGGRQG